MTNNTASDTSPRPLTGPGTRLAQARQDLHLSHGEVATRLHLSSRQIEALERDDYASLPGPTYVRGYLKSYALLLGLAPAPILDAYAQAIARPAAPDFSIIAPHKEITSRHHQVRFTTYLVVAIVIGLAFAWWQGRDNRSVGPVPGEPPVAAPAAQAPAESPPAMGASAVPEQKTEAGGAVPGKPAAVTAPAAATGKTEASPAAAPPANAATAPAASLPAGPRARLVLYADQDCWADIRDARQVKLLYETVPAGRAVTLEGIAPLSVYLGNADGVRLDYNGRPVDVSRHKRGVIARFTLGEEEAAVAPAQ